MKNKIINPYIVQTAIEFWEMAGSDQQIPPDIQQAIALTLPLNVVILSDLSFSRIQNWFLQREISLEIGITDRLLHGFLVCQRGEGIIFVNGSDSDDERRFTIAHEASHFMVDYLRPRLVAIEKFGPGITNVLDGIRQPTVQEQVKEVVTNTSLQPFSHLLEKTGSGSFLNYSIWSAENNADALAVELLAPYKMVSTLVKSSTQNPSYDGFRDTATGLLSETYRLPESIAGQYAAKIAYSLTGGITILEKLGLKLS